VEVEYELTAEDVAALTVYHHATAPQLRRHRLKNSCFFGAVGAASLIVVIVEREAERRLTQAKGQTPLAAIQPQA